MNDALRIPPCLFLLPVAQALAGCGPTVSAHTVDVEVRYDGVVTHGVLRFPDHEEEVQGGDSSCGFFSGNCGTMSSVHAEVSGDAPILGARLETAGDGTARTYDLRLVGNGADKVPEGRVALYGPDVQCRVYHFTDRRDLSGFGEPDDCYNTTLPVTVTLTFRDGDEGE